MADVKDQDQSMEEILQSIKRIIADEGDPALQPSSEVLELTEMLAEEEAQPAEAPTIASMSIDEIMAAPLSGAAPEVEFEPTPVAIPEPVVIPEPIAAAPAMSEEMLISNTTFAASAAALDVLKHAPVSANPPAMSNSFRSGTTVEDLVIESLKPMVKDWLDANLAGIVERLVEREVRRLSGR